MYIYVATSWRNTWQGLVVATLRKEGYGVYDFKDDEGFHWKEVDEQWRAWTPQEYVRGLAHTCADRGFNRDMDALRLCDALVYVMPCGPSASMELGFAKGQGKPCVVYVPELREADLMVKMADLVTPSFEAVLQFLSSKNV